MANAASESTTEPTRDRGHDVVLPLVIAVFTLRRSEVK